MSSATETTDLNPQHSSIRWYCYLNQILSQTPSHSNTATRSGGSNLGCSHTPERRSTTNSLHLPSTIHQLNHSYQRPGRYFSLGHSSVLCGDYNAHHTDWGCVSNNQRGLLIKNFSGDTDTDILAPPTPKRFGYNSASTIDFALTRHFHWRTSVNSVSELSSDHNPIILNFKTSIKFDFPTRTVTTDWNLFRHTLKTNTSFRPITALSREDIEKLTNDITSNILHAYDLSSKPVRNNSKTYIDSDLKPLFKQRNRARKIWQFTRDPNDKTILNRLQNKINRKDFITKAIVYVFVSYYASPLSHRVQSGKSARHQSGKY
ncbi:probable RNA-directed DNA polymerase from transposon X-element [Trichonephila clavipes]|nr:probable RNA-directed DNA polymerase from transposon X-element [Trichonephila clavipes]